MDNNEWRIILARVRALSVFLCAIAIGYFVFTPSASERNLAALFAVGGLVVLGWTWRRLRRMEAQARLGTNSSFERFNR